MFFGILGAWKPFRFLTPPRMSFPARLKLLSTGFPPLSGLFLMPGNPGTTRSTPCLMPPARPFPSSSHNRLLFWPCRVGTAHYCAIPPSEPGVRVSPYRARAVTKLWIPPEPAIHYERSVFRRFRRSEYRALSGSSRSACAWRSIGPNRDETGTGTG